MLLIFVYYNQFHLQTIKNLTFSFFNSPQYTYCYSYCSLEYQIILELYFAFCSCNSSSIGHNVSLSVRNEFMEVLCYCQCTISVTVVVVYNISTLWCYTLHFSIIFCILSCERSSIGHNVSLSVGNEFYGSAMLFLMYDCC